VTARLVRELPNSILRLCASSPELSEELLETFTGPQDEKQELKRRRIEIWEQATQNLSSFTTRQELEDLAANEALFEAYHIGVKAQLLQVEARKRLAELRFPISLLVAHLLRSMRDVPLSNWDDAYEGVTEAERSMFRSVGSLLKKLYKKDDPNWRAIAVLIGPFVISFMLREHALELLSHN